MSLIPFFNSSKKPKVAAHLREVVRDLARVVGEDAVLWDPEDLRLYEYDGSIEQGRPDLVVLPETTQHVSEVVKVAARHGLPIVPRGAGTGLSGGAIARKAGIVLAFGRMNRILEIDVPNRRAVVQPGVVNLELSNAASKLGLYFAPDPSSQKACTIGGNVAENSGGPHTLCFGVTVNHVLGLEVVMADGRIVELGSKAVENAGYDLRGFFIGSEGTVGVTTKAVCKLIPVPESVATLLAIYNSIEEAANTVVAVTQAGITPAAMEMMDGWTLRTIEAATQAGYPLDSAAVLLIELEGLKEATEEDAVTIEKLCAQVGAREVRRARSNAERDKLWAGRKNAFGALGRVSPSYYVQDGVIPRTKVPQTLQKVEEISKKYGLRIGNIFHAGDGNLHPLIMFNHHDPEETRRTQKAGEEILEYCISVGGSITGEHGVGTEKQEMMGSLFSEDEIEIMTRLRNVFNPKGTLNPQKIFPTTRRCRETMSSTPPLPEMMQPVAQ